MMKTTKIFFLLITVLSIYELKAQTNFNKGYYITNSNDTIRGYIEYRSEERNSKVCVFKTTLEKEIPRRFYPNDILGYAILNNFYESHKYIDRKFEESTVFFKVIIRGKLSLLTYNNVYLAKTEDNTIHKISVTYLQEGRTIKKDYRGIGTLKSLISDCPSLNGDSIMSNSEHLNYRQIFEKYNACVGSNYTKSSFIKVKSKVDYGIVISPSLSKITMGAPLEKNSFDDSFVMTGGGFVSFFIPQVNEQFRLVAELTFGKHDQYSYFRNGTSENDLFVNYWLIKAPVFMRYEYKHVFIDFGLHDQFIVSQNIRYRTESPSGNTIITTSPAVASMPGFSYGYLVGVGMNYSIGGHIVRTSARFSQSKSDRILELMMSLQISNKALKDY